MTMPWAIKRVWAVKYFTDLLMLSKEDAEKIVDDLTEEELDELFATLAAAEEN